MPQQGGQPGGGDLPAIQIDGSPSPFASLLHPGLPGTAKPLRWPDSGADATLPSLVPVTTHLLLAAILYLRIALLQRPSRARHLRGARQANGGAAVPPLMSAGHNGNYMILQLSMHSGPRQGLSRLRSPLQGVPQAKHRYDGLGGNSRARLFTQQEYVVRGRGAERQRQGQLKAPNNRADTLIEQM